MNTDLSFPTQPDVQITPAQVNFPGFSSYLTSAHEIAEYIDNIVLTDENVKQVKSDLAAARKVTNSLDAKRKEIKKSILSDYETFESQIKELCGIISEAEDTLRSKVRDMEEREREEKRDQIFDIWEKRAWNYKIPDLLDEIARTQKDVPTAFNRFLTPQHLNKTTSLKSVETDMTKWLEEREQELETMEGMGEDYVTEYLLSLDIVKAIKNVQDRQNIVTQVRANAEDDIASFVVTGTANIMLTEMLLQQNKITYFKK